jgi:hypothetical protein
MRAKSHSPPPPHPTQNRSVFDLLYTLISYGHESPEAAKSIDPPDDFFRIRMVSVAGREAWFIDAWS